VSQPATSFTFTAGLEAGRSYSFRIYAIDAAGNKSKYSNTVSVSLPEDTVPPTAPVVSVTDVGPTYVSLAWSSIDDGPHVWAWVFQDGSPVIQGSAETSATIVLLEPETTYTFTVQARDFGGNWSPLSNLITVTTAPTNPDDTTPPTTPANLTNAGMTFQDGETWLFWEQSTDDLDPQEVIRYDIYLNGVLDHSVVGHDMTILYGTVGVLNTFQVIAVDTAGNQSPPATFTIDIP
jgi:chitin-binding protein